MGAKSIIKVRSKISRNMEGGKCKQQIKATLNLGGDNMKKSISKQLAVLLFFVMIFTLVGCSDSTTKTTADETEADTSEEENEPTNKLGNNIYNILNGEDSSAAFQGDYIYVIHHNNIYKCKSGDEANDHIQLTNNESEAKLLIHNIQVLGDWVYFIEHDSLCRVSIDGEGEIEQLSPNIDKYTRYFVTKDKIFLTKTEWQDKEHSTSYVAYKPMDQLDKYVKLHEGNLNGLDAKGRIHFWIYNESSGESKYYSMDKNGENIKKEKRELTIPLEVDDYMITIEKNPDKENYRYCNCLFATKKGTSNKKQVNTDNASSAWRGDDGYIYYTIFVDNYSLYRVKPDGTNWQQVNSWF